MQIQFYDEKDAWIEAIVEYIKRLLGSISGDTHIALTGGKTPRPIYEALRSLDFHRSHVYVADERYVPFDHVDSNYAMILQSFVQNQKIGSFHYIDTAQPIDAAAAAYAEELKNIPENTFDIIFLGIGPDGHIFSLFPHTQEVERRDFLVIHTTTDVFTVHDRITMTMPYAVSAKHIILFASGADKMPIIDEFQKGEKTVNELPLMALKDHPSLSIFYLK